MRPLEGLLVIALEQAVAAPYCTRSLGDLGARVIKVEARAGGDFARHYDDVVRGMSAHFVWANRNKESITLDLKNAKGRKVLDSLLARADVFVQNLAPGAAERLELDASHLHERYPSLIAVDVSGYGRGGPHSNDRAYDLLVQCEAGSTAITGTPEAPAKPGIPLADIGAGMYAFSSVLAALLVRQRTGRGTAISVALFDVVTDWMGFALNQARHGGHDPVPNGVSSPMVSPYGAYETSDGQTLVLGTTNDREWRRLAERVLGRPDLATDPRYASNADRVARRSELDAVIADWAGGHTLAEARSAADAADLGHARLNRPSDVLDHPQLVERNRWFDVETPVGPVPSLLPPVEVDDWEWRMDAVPGVGEHTDSVLLELGYTESEIAVLRESKAL